MNRASSCTPDGQATFEIVGFDRTQFVSDVLTAATVPGYTHVAYASFEADGVRSTGRLTVQGADRRQLDRIGQQLQLVRGLVRVTQCPV